MIITAYSTKHHGYTAFDIRPSRVNVALPWEQMTGYHSTPQEAKLWATTHPGELVSSSRTSGIVGTVTSRFVNRSPELQHLKPTYSGPRHPFVSKHDGRNLADMDISQIEDRALGHYLDASNLTATQAAEARDRFNEAYPDLKDFWEGVQKSYQDRTSFAELYMQEVKPPDAVIPENETQLDQRKQPTGRRNELRGHTSADSEKRSIPGRKSKRP